MAEEVKFTKEEMDRIQGIQKDYIGVQGELGQLSISRLRLETQMNSLDNREDDYTNPIEQPPIRGAGYRR